MRFGWVLILALAIGCETQVDPVEEGGPVYYWYGYLDSRRLSQVVHVEALRPTAVDPAAGPNVALVEMSSGSRVDCERDSTLYRCDAQVREKEVYRLEVTGVRGRGMVSARVPAMPQAELARPIIQGGRVEQAITWAPLEAGPAVLEARYVVTYRNQTDTLAVDYRGGFSGTTMNLRMSVDLDVARTRLVIPSDDTTAVLKSVSVHVQVRSEGDPTSAVNGFGTFGAVVSNRIEIPITEEVLRVLGFSRGA